MAPGVHCDVPEKVAEHDLCSTDSGNSYTSAISSRGASEWSDVSDAVGDPHATDLNCFHEHADFSEVISKGNFVKMKDITTCCRGEGNVEVYSIMAGSRAEMAVVKRLPMARVNVNKAKPANERNWHRRLYDRDAEDPLTEIGIFCYLSKRRDLPSYILKMHAAFAVEDEAWLVLEYADEGDLFAAVQSRRINDRQTRNWMWQLLQGLKYLHQHHIGHRDVSLENVLLCQGAVRLMDFGQAVRSHSPNGVLRYFIAAGKPYYRAPETYIPNQQSIQVITPPYSSPCHVAVAETTEKDFICHVRLPESAIPGQRCNAQPWGYPVQPVDVFSCAVCMMIAKVGSPPWRQARPTDGHFKWTQANGISALARAWQKTLPPGMDDLLSQMLKADSEARPTVDDCLAHEWLGALNDASVETHNPTSFWDEDPTVAMRSGPESTDVFYEDTAVSMRSGQLLGDVYYNDTDLICRCDSPEDFECAMQLDGFVDTAHLGDPYKAEEEDATRGSAMVQDGPQDIDGAPVLLPLIRECRTQDVA